MSTKKPPTPKEQPSSEQLARRRLLKLAAYIPPVILGVMLVGERAWAKEKKPCRPHPCRPHPCRPRPTCRPQLCKPAQCKPYSKICNPKMGCIPFRRKG